MRCPKCKSKLGYLRIKSQEWMCRNCGAISLLSTIKKKQKLKSFAGFPDKDV